MSAAPKLLLAVEAEGISLQSFNTYNFNIENQIMTSWNIYNTNINSTIIGSSEPSDGFFTNLAARDSFTLKRSDQDTTSVEWDNDDNVFRIKICTELDNIKICDNTISAINPNNDIGNINLVPKSNGQININGPTTVYSNITPGNFQVIMPSGGTSIMTKNDISLLSSSASIFLYSPNYVRLTSGSLLTFGDTCNSISNPISTGKLLIKGCSDVVVSSGSLTLENAMLAFDNQKLTTLSKEIDGDFNIENKSGDINITPSISGGSVNIFGKANFGESGGGFSNVSSLEYNIDRFTMGGAITVGNPKHDIVISMFSVDGLNQNVSGTMPSSNIPNGIVVSDGTFKVIVCSRMATGCTYTLHFDKLITPNPPLLISGSPIIPQYATKLIFKRQSQSVQLIYDGLANAWVLLTAGVYVE